MTSGHLKTEMQDVVVLERKRNKMNSKVVKPSYILKIARKEKVVLNHSVREFTQSLEKTKVMEMEL